MPPDSCPVLPKPACSEAENPCLAGRDGEGSLSVCLQDGEGKGGIRWLLDFWHCCLGRTRMGVPL